MSDSAPGGTDISLEIRQLRERRMDIPARVFIELVHGARASIRAHIQACCLKQPVPDVLYSQSVKQVGPADSNTLRKR